MTKDNLDYFLKQIEDKYIMQGWPSDPKLRNLKIRGITDEIKLFLRGLDKPVTQYNISEIWSYFFMSTENQSWLQVLAIYYFKKISSKRNGGIVQYWPMLKDWVNRIDHWGFSDMISSILSQIVEDSPDIIYPTLCDWAVNENPWHKRLAIVSLVYYYRCRKTFLPFKKIIELVEPQMEVQDYYLQKGIGWVLKELSQAYPDETFYFIMNNTDKISATAFSPAIEKFSKEKKEKIKTVRKKSRKNS